MWESCGSHLGGRRKSMQRYNFFFEDLIFFEKVSIVECRFTFRHPKEKLIK